MFAPEAPPTEVPVAPVIVSGRAADEDAPGVVSVAPGCPEAEACGGPAGAAVEVIGTGDACEAEPAGAGLGAPTGGGTA